MSKKNERYVVWLPCKPYVKQYLLNFYNAPDFVWPEIVSFKKDKLLREDFVSRLKKEGRYENKYKDLFRYTANVPVEISKDDFYRYGWSLSNTEVVRFGKFVERRIKDLLFVHVDTFVALGFPIATAIRQFQKSYNFTEDTWSYDTIRREYTRHMKARGPLAKRNISSIINDIIVGEIVPRMGQLPKEDFL